MWVVDAIYKPQNDAVDDDDMHPNTNINLAVPPKQQPQEPHTTTQPPPYLGGLPGADYRYGDDTGRDVQPALVIGRHYLN